MHALKGEQASRSFARRSLLIAMMVAIPGFALGIVAIRTGQVAGLEIVLVLSGLVFAGSALLVLIAFPRVPVQLIATIATVYFAFYICAGAAIAAVDGSQRLGLFVYLVWFFPLLVFNRLVNNVAVGRALGYALRILPLLFVLCLVPRLIVVLGVDQRILLVAFGLSFVGFGMMLATVTRYREEYLIERERAEALKVAAEVLESISDCFISLDSGLRLVYLNDAACTEFGTRRATALTRTVDDAAPGFFSRAGLAELQAATGNPVASMFEAQNERCDRWYELRCFPRPDGMSVYFRNITGRKAAEAKIERLAFYDTLTDLPNRRLLRERLERALSAVARTRSIGAILFLDLDDFKTLNDTLGHDVGDRFLQQVAARLTSCVRAVDTVARLGGDEFVVMLEALSADAGAAASEAKLVSETILQTLLRPYQFESFDYTTTASIGVALLTGESNTSDELLKRADLAMYRAKAEGRSTVRFFDPAMETFVATRAALRSDLRRALQKREFELHYQPLLDGDGKVVGAEALLRWRHPSRDLVPPAEFIPVAEEAGLIVEIGRWVLEVACAQLGAWARDPETAALTVSVNVSLRQFVDPNFVNLVHEVLRSSDADPGRLKLEITESSAMQNVEDTIARMSSLKASGVGFAIDDFGTGYSSLSHLKRLPLDQLKIDQSFVNDVLTSATDASIVRTIITLGQNLNLAVIAEGVETEGQHAFLERAGCSLFQGYLFSHALIADEFAAFATSMTARNLARLSR